MTRDVPARLLVLGTWGRLALAFAVGAATTLALPPYHLIPILWLTLPLFVWLLEGCRSRGATVWIGWAFGFGYFLFGLSWVANAFFVDAQTFGALAWPALAGLGFAMGVFFVGVALLTNLIPPTAHDATADIRASRLAARALLFAAAWMLQEWVRNWILTGFPWNPMATVWTESATPIGPALLQAVSVIGTFGLSLITVMSAALVAPLGAAPIIRSAWLWMSVPLVCLTLIALAGSERLAQGPTTFVPETKLRLVQPNIPEAEKMRPELAEAHLRDYVQMSIENRPADVKAVIWGEDAVSVLLDRYPAARVIAAEAAPPGGVLITGGDRAESETRVFNSLYVIAPDATILATYDKFHLVPFGEFMPLADILPFPQFVGGIGFSSGPGLRTLNVPGLPPFTPLICFEAIFPGAVILRGAPDSKWLLNLTNDSWFGTATGPYQHFATARLRAIEEGVPLIRTADTGISAVIDPYGRVIARLGLDQRGVIDAPLPAALASETLFARVGNLLSLVFATIVSGAALVMYRSTK